MSNPLYHGYSHAPGLYTTRYVLAFVKSNFTDDYYFSLRYKIINCRSNIDSLTLKFHSFTASYMAQPGSFFFFAIKNTLGCMIKSYNDIMCKRLVVLYANQF